MSLFDNISTAVSSTLSDLWKQVPSDARTLFKQASAAAEHHHYDEAEKRLIAVRERYPDLVETYILLGELYQAMGRPKEALVALDLALERRDDPSLRLQAAEQALLCDDNTALQEAFQHLRVLYLRGESLDTLDTDDPSHPLIRCNYLTAVANHKAKRNHAALVSLDEYERLFKRRLLSKPKPDDPYEPEEVQAIAEGVEQRRILKRAITEAALLRVDLLQALGRSPEVLELLDAQPDAFESAEWASSARYEALSRITEPTIARSIPRRLLVPERDASLSSKEAVALANLHCMLGDLETSNSYLCAVRGGLSEQQRLEYDRAFVALRILTNLNSETITHKEETDSPLETDISEALPTQLKIAPETLEAARRLYRYRHPRPLDVAWSVIVLLQVAASHLESIDEAVKAKGVFGMIEASSGRLQEASALLTEANEPLAMLKGFARNSREKEAHRLVSQFQVSLTQRLHEITQLLAHDVAPPLAPGGWSSTSSLLHKQQPAPTHTGERQTEPDIELSELSQRSFAALVQAPRKTSSYRDKPHTHSTNAAERTTATSTTDSSEETELDELGRLEKLGELGEFGEEDRWKEAQKRIATALEEKEIKGVLAAFLGAEVRGSADVKPKGAISFEKSLTGGPRINDLPLIATKGPVATLLTHPLLNPMRDPQEALHKQLLDWLEAPLSYSVSRESITSRCDTSKCKASLALASDSSATAGSSPTTPKDPDSTGKADPHQAFFSLEQRAFRIASHFPIMEASLHKWHLDLETERASLNQPIQVACVGEFNVGKSSLINRLLGESLVPTGVLPTTAQVVSLSWGPVRLAKVILTDKSTRVIPLDELNLVVTENSETIARIEVTLPHPLLKRIRLIDSPGFNALESRHEDVSQEILLHTDAILWIMDANQALTSSERELMLPIQQASKRLFLVVNKIDRFLEPGEPLESNADWQRLSHYLSEEWGDHCAGIIPLSTSWAATNPDDPYLSRLWTLLTHEIGEGASWFREDRIQRALTSGRDELHTWCHKLELLQVSHLGVIASDAPSHVAYERLMALRKELYSHLYQGQSDPREHETTTPENAQDPLGLFLPPDYGSSSRLVIEEALVGAVEAIQDLLDLWSDDLSQAIHHEAATAYTHDPLDTMLDRLLEDRHAVYWPMCQALVVREGERIEQLIDQHHVPLAQRTSELTGRIEYDPRWESLWEASRTRLAGAIHRELGRLMENKTEKMATLIQMEMRQWSPVTGASLRKRISELEPNGIFREVLQHQHDDRQQENTRIQEVLHEINWERFLDATYMCIKDIRFLRHISND